ncbi:helix-turn-helix domain-containing protein [Niabella pedocola]|uniref:Helix-turn-helix domain-containing protein n=1 Tax=Niabella pedocola TaxID=1752077 RepID=A0ABS8PRN9_9BACT|nr:helix-turn-helix domain-containing protein [Niabella pedocola]MCD2423747.1 helix-turn-helix domain-containing protein [Niabella pedocola]
MVSHKIHHLTPHPLLLPFIKYYSIREIDITRHTTLKKLTTYGLQTSIDFFLGTPFQIINIADSTEQRFNRCMIRGLRTSCKYLLNLTGRFLSFNIKFTPTGMYQLLGIPMEHFTDQDIPLATLNALPADEIAERLALEDSNDKRRQIIESYLIKKINTREKKIIYLNDSFYEKMIEEKADHPIQQLSIRYHLSERQLERCFLKEIGTTPKGYEQLIRFDRLIQKKITCPTHNWTSLCHDAGYYDQMHMIRAFKAILKITPKEFVASNYAI